MGVFRLKRNYKNRRMATYGLYKMMRLNHIRRINVAILPLLIYKLMKLMLMDLIWI